MKNKIKPWSPWCWPLWILLGIFWIIIQLPHPIRIRIGKYLGKITFLFPTQIKHTTKVNLRLCFPELSISERNKLAKKNFVSLGIAFIESAMAWLLPKQRLKHLYTLHGYEHAEWAFKKGKGILLITPHFTCVELAARFISLEKDFGILYRPHKKPWLSAIQAYFRKKHFDYCIRSDQVKKMLATLRDNKAIWYAYDIDENGKRSIFAPFFDIPTATLTTVSDLVRVSNATVIPMRYFRRDDLSGYDIVLLPPLTHFPSNTKLEDATQLNIILEQIIRQKPEQYVWQYKRFKTRPHGQKRYYSSHDLR